ncbi:heavy-metal-associated domain-containing protein [Alkaliphilus peptidifermentans]|uniref:Copper ion binding protein n=1 Tax=Alkaliphilus peptidifermentans DSM 18978 TaxID=1120976 RepID=A0A1G5ASU7_9FIRM|nr:heavy-metal-associated domain-containing protein [Alkaliphilus peptidifermentans]SCX80921.1 copper ion binding protein [Alkaliphilus peptidifermentans DSM 18978]
MKKKINIDGMSCGHCVSHVKEALLEIEGVKDVKVDLADKSALVELEADVSDERLNIAIAEAGYEPLGIEKL